MSDQERRDVETRVGGEAGEGGEGLLLMLYKARQPRRGWGFNLCEMRPQVGFKQGHDMIMIYDFTTRSACCVENRVLRDLREKRGRVRSSLQWKMLVDSCELRRSSTHFEVSLSVFTGVRERNLGGSARIVVCTAGPMVDDKARAMATWRSAY